MGKKVVFTWDVNSKSWRVTLDGEAISPEVAATLIAAARRVGLSDPEELRPDSDSPQAPKGDSGGRNDNGPP